MRIRLYVLMLVICASITLAEYSKDPTDYVLYETFDGSFGNLTNSGCTLNTTSGFDDTSSANCPNTKNFYTALGMTDNTVMMHILVNGTSPFDAAKQLIFDVHNGVAAFERVLIQEGVGDNEAFTLYTGSYDKRQVLVEGWNNVSVTVNSTGLTWCFNGVCALETAGTTSLDYIKAGADGGSYVLFNVDLLRVWNGTLADEPEAPPPDPDGPAPTNCFVNNSAPRINEQVVFNCTWSDFSALSGWHFEDNITNTNTTHSTTFGPNNESTYTYTVSSVVGNNISAKFHANDSLNQWNVSPLMSILVANTPPTVALSAPANGQVNRVNFTASFTPQDVDGQNLSCDLVINGTTHSSNATITNGTIAYLTSDLTSEGVYFWNVTCSDGTDSGTSATRNFTLDYTVPAIIVNIPTVAAFSNNASGFTLNYTVSDNHELYRGNITLYYSNNTFARAIKYYHDLNGSEFGEELEVNWSGLSDASYYVELNFSDSEAESPDMPFYHNYIDGTYIDFVDGSLGVDVTAEFQIINSYTGEEIPIPLANLNHFAEEDGKHIIFGGVFTKTPMMNGLANAFKFRYVYSSNNGLELKITDESIGRLIVDTGGFRNIFWQHRSLLEKGWQLSTFMDGDSVVVEFWKEEYRDEIDFDPLSGGTNFNGAYTVTLTKDTTVPASNYTYPNGVNVTTSPQISLVANMTEINNATLDLWHNFNGTFMKNATYNYIHGTNTFLTTNLTDGVYVWRLIVDDAAGNGFDTDNMTFTVDTQTPAVTAISPGNNTNQSDDDTEFKFNVTDGNAILNCSFYYLEAFNQSDFTITKGITQMFTLFNLPNGIHNWSVECYDEFGRMGSTGTINFSINSSLCPACTPCTTTIASTTSSLGGGGGSAASYAQKQSNATGLQILDAGFNKITEGFNLFYLLMGLLLLRYAIKEHKKGKKVDYL